MGSSQRSRSSGRSTPNTSESTEKETRGASLVLMRQHQSTSSATEWPTAEHRFVSHGQQRLRSVAISRIAAQLRTWIPTSSRRRSSRQHVSIESEEAWVRTELDWWNVQGMLLLVMVRLVMLEACCVELRTDLRLVGRCQWL